MPNRPITATRKSKPVSSFVEPKVRRSAPVTGSVPTAASAKPSIIEAMRLERRLLAHADEGAEGEQVDREELRRAELEREAGDDRREERDHDHRDQRADERGGERRGERVAGAPLLRQRIAVEGGGHRPGLARDVEQDRGDGAAEERAPVDAREQDDRRGGAARAAAPCEKVSGSRMATPFAPPRPGSTPMITPRIDADEHQRQVLQRQRDAEAVQRATGSRPSRSVQPEQALRAGPWAAAP